MNKITFHLFLLAFILCHCSPRQEEIKTFPLNESSPVASARVVTAEAIRSTLIEHISSTGIAQAQRCQVIRPQVQGYIKNLPIIEGQIVNSGQILIELDKQGLELNLKEAHAEYLRSCIEYGKKQGEFRNSQKLNFLSSDFALLDLEEAKSKYLKTMEEFAADRTFEIEMLRAKAELNAAELFADPNKEPLLALQSGLDQAYYRLQRARWEYDACSIIAPFSGVIGELRISEGDIVGTGQECCRLYDLSTMNVVLGIIETEINSIACGRRVELEFAAIPGQIYMGQIISINPVIDEQSKTCRISVSVDNQNGDIKAGMFAIAAIDQKFHPNVLMVPNDAIIERDQRQLLFVVRGGVAKWCYVDTGCKNETCTEIIRSSQNLQEGDSVIVSGHLTLVNDSPIAVLQHSPEELSNR